MVKKISLFFLILGFLALGIALGIKPAFTEANDGPALTNPESAQASSTQREILYTRWIPSVIYADGKTKTRLEAWTDPGAKIKSIKLTSGSVNFGDLNDDGVNGDRIAGDGIWTYGGYTRSYANYWFGTHVTAGFSLDVESNNGRDGITQYDTSTLGIVRKLNIKAVKVKRNVWATQRGVFLIDKNGKLLDGKIPLCDIHCGKGNELVFRKFFEVFKDRFHFLAVMPVTNVYNPTNFSENVPYFVWAKNNIRNVGMEVFNNTGSFGSKGKLEGIFYHSFGYGAILDHEIGHNWGIYIGDALGFSSGSHYNAYCNLVGQMGNMPQLRLEDNGDGTYKATKVWDEQTDHPYTPLTLYLMGLIPPSEVPPVMALKNTNYPNFNKIPADQFDVFTIQDIMASNGGERQPAYPNTPRKFRMGLIVVTDRKPTQAQFDFFSAVAIYFGSKKKGDYYLMTFYDATGGRAALNTRLPAVKNK